MQHGAAFTKQYNAQKALYAADSGAELALFDMKQHEAGYEIQKTLSLDSVEISYEIKSRTASIPHEEDNTLLSLDPTKFQTFALFKDTSISDTPQIYDLQDGSTTFSISFHSQLQAENCLRWTLFGFKKGSIETLTESMGGVLPCFPAPLSTLIGNGGDTITSGSFKNKQGIYFPDYPINTFLQEHTQNYITLSNISAPPQSLFLNLKFIGQTFADQSFNIISSGVSQNFIQTKQVTVPYGEILSALYFSIIHSQ